MQNANVGGYQARGFVEVLAASQSVVSKKWFQGTADAVRQYLWLFDNAVRDGVEDFLILSGACVHCTSHRRLCAMHVLHCCSRGRQDGACMSVTR